MLASHRRFCVSWGRCHERIVTDWQKLACAIALRGSVAIITGGPGTGKTYTVARLLALLFAMAPKGTEPRIALAAPTVVSIYPGETSKR